MTATSSFTSPEQTARWVGIAQSVERLAMVWTVRRTHPGAGGDFPLTPRQILGQNQHLWGSLSRVLNQPGPGVDHPPPNSAKVKGRVEIYRYLPSGQSWPVVGELHFSLNVSPSELKVAVQITESRGPRLKAKLNSGDCRTHCCLPKFRVYQNA
jgi:hypothetical protein